MSHVIPLALDLELSIERLIDEVPMGAGRNVFKPGATREQCRVRLFEQGMISEWEFDRLRPPVQIYVARDRNDILLAEELEKVYSKDRDRRDARGRIRIATRERRA